jgi:hypothetical protein
VKALTSTLEGTLSFVRILLDPSAPTSENPNLALLRRFLDFRAASITRLVRAAADTARGMGLGVGLDCFSPSLASTVGQDLGALDRTCDWIKVMTYGHTLAPAGLPFELLNLADWLVRHKAIERSEVLGWLSGASGLPLRATPEALREDGLTPEALASEVRRGRLAGVRTLLAGIELAAARADHCRPGRLPVGRGRRTGALLGPVAHPARAAGACPQKLAGLSGCLSDPLRQASGGLPWTWR